MKKYVVRQKKIENNIFRIGNEEYDTSSSLGHYHREQIFIRIPRLTWQHFEDVPNAHPEQRSREDTGQVRLDYRVRSKATVSGDIKNQGLLTVF